VSSVARECVDADRGNECHVDADQLGVTCYSSCSTHYCNDETPRPTWHDFRRHRLPASDNKDNVNDNDDNNDEDILSRAAAKNDDELTLRLPPDTGRPVSSSNYIKQPDPKAVCINHHMKDYLSKYQL